MRSGSLTFSLDRYFDQLADANRDYRVAARRSGQFEYLYGTLIGTLITAVLLGLIAIGIGRSRYSVADPAVATAFGCAIAGMLGAAASVSWRVSVGGDLAVDATAGLLTLRRLGALRPSIGAVFGLAFYFAVRSGFIDIGSNSKNFYFYAFVAFLGGFSERLVPDMLRAAEARFASGSNQPPASRERWWADHTD
jgi:hypothetical protein